MKREENKEIIRSDTTQNKPYLETSSIELWKARIPWLLLLMVSSVFTSRIITRYESAIGTYAILTAFFPMLMDTGGNAGGQASVTVIRGLSTGELTPKDARQILAKELRVALLCGLTLAVAAFIKVMAVDFGFAATFVGDDGQIQNNLLIAAAVSITVFFAVMIAKAIGALLPIGAKIIGFDPAVMASPFITTIVDTLTLMIYFRIATVVLKI